MYLNGPQRPAVPIVVSLEGGNYNVSSSPSVRSYNYPTGLNANRFTPPTLLVGLEAVKTDVRTIKEVALKLYN